MPLRFASLADFVDAAELGRSISSTAASLPVLSCGVGGNEVVSADPPLPMDRADSGGDAVALPRSPSDLPLPADCGVGGRGAVDALETVDKDDEVE